MRPKRVNMGYKEGIHKKLSSSIVRMGACHMKSDSSLKWGMTEDGMKVKTKDNTKRLGNAT